MQTTLKFEPNENQKKAIEKIDGTIMVLAGPGTGKTFTIIERIKYMIKKGIEPDKILCMTFSEAAANEMKTRLNKEIGEASNSLKISTYHAFCSEIIKNYNNLFNLSEDLEVIDEIRQYNFMREVITEYKPNLNKSKMGDIYNDIQGLINKVGKIKKSLITKHEYYKILETGFAWGKELKKMEDKRDFALSKNRGTKVIEENIEKFKEKIEKTKEIWEIYELYNKKIHEKNLIDFDDMIVMVLEKFKNDKEFLREISSNWDYIFVDEYQDTNKAQNQLIFELEQSRGLGNLFVVGDDDQLIYAFQGAQMDTLENFLERYPNTEVICLNENNRSTQTILDYSYEVINQDEFRLENNPKFKNKNISKKLIAKNESVICKERKIQKHQFKDIKQENNFVIEEIIKLINSNEMPKKITGEPDLSKIAVLSSSNMELEAFATLLKGKGIQYQIRNTKNIFEIKSSVLTYFYLKILENSRMYMDKLFGLLLSAPFNFNEADFCFLVSKTNIQNEKDFISIIRENINYKWAEPERINNFIKTYDELKQIRNGSTLKDTLLAIVNKTGILPYFASSPVNRYDNIMGLKKLIEQAETFSTFMKNYSITDFVKYLDMAFNNNIPIKTDEDIFTKNAIQLSTIHSSKGKEFDYVFMVNLISSNWENSRKGCSDDFSLPIKDYPDNYADIKDLRDTMKKAENLKKLFVGITRAKYGLYLTYSDMNGKKTQEITTYLSSVKRPDLIEHYSHSLDTESYLDEIVKNMTQDKLDYSAFLRNAIESRLEDFILSPSSMNSYLNCPKEFLFSNIMNIPTQDSDTTRLEYGNAIHSVMEWIYKDNSEYPSLNQILEKFKYEINKRPFSSKTVREIYEKRGLENLEKFYPLMVLTKFDKVIKTEVNLYSELDGYKIKGKIDRIDKNDDGTYTIYDYKTGDGSNKNSQIREGGAHEDYYNQLKFYKLLFELQNPDMKVSKTAILYPETKTIIERVFDEEDMQDIKDKIKFVYENIQDLYFECKNDKSEDNCKYCNYKQMCKLI